MFESKWSSPICIWSNISNNNSSIISIKWSNIRPSIIFALNSESILFIIDLLEQTKSMVIKLISFF